VEGVVVTTLSNNFNICLLGKTSRYFIWGSRMEHWTSHIGRSANHTVEHQRSFGGVEAVYFKLHMNTIKERSRGRSVSIVSDYGLDDRGSIPDRGRGFSSSFCVQTGSGAHQPPVQWVPGVISPGAKRGRGVMLTTHPHLVPRLRMSRSYTSSHPKRLHGV
jgi:hypothetical protein